MTLFKSARKLLVVAAMCLGALAVQGAPASAANDPEPFRYLHIAGTAVCDAPAGEWVITWAVTNTFNVGATIGNVRSTPADHAIANLPTEIPAGQTVTGVQRIPSTTYSAYLVFDANWHDGPVSYNVNWPVHIKMFCRVA